MSNCPSTCDTTTCLPCAPYDNCGCLNPTTFDCVTKPGTCEALGITDDMTGRQAIAAACTAVSDIQAAAGKILIDANDTCPPRYLWEILEEGTNISLVQTGTGCDKKVAIHAVEGGVPVDINVKVSANDSISGYLYDKIDTGTYMVKSILNAGLDEKLKIQVVPSTLLSSDAGNQLTIGADGKLKTAYSAPDGSETKIVQGVGTVISGTGTLLDPYIISTNPSVQVARPCFDGIWRLVTVVATGNPNVIHSSGTAQYRYRYDGSIEFRGSMTYTVNFGPYTSGPRKFTFTVGSIPTTCVSLGEQVGTADLKSINYIDQQQVGLDQVTQQYGYIIRKSANTIILELQSSFTNATSKVIVVNFEGAISHPQI